jgi:hypothetical protein
VVLFFERLCTLKEQRRQTLCCRTRQLAVQLPSDLWREAMRLRETSGRSNGPKREQSSRSPVSGPLLAGRGDACQAQEVELGWLGGAPGGPVEQRKGPLGDHKVGGVRASSRASAPADATAADMSDVGRFVTSMESMVAASARRVQAS